MPWNAFFTAKDLRRESGRVLQLLRFRELGRNQRRGLVADFQLALLMIQVQEVEVNLRRSRWRAAC